MILTAIGLLSGCGLRSFQKQTVLLVPKVSVNQSALGRNKEIVLVVVDERTNPVLGHRAAGGGMQGAIISASPEPVAVVIEAMKRGLMRQGFQVAQTPNPALPKLDVQLRAFEYLAGERGFVLKVSVNAAAKVEVSKRRDRVFQKMFAASDEKSPLTAPDADSNSEHINAVLSSLLNQILNDRGLLEVLVE